MTQSPRTSEGAAIDRDALLAFLDDLLEPAKGRDFCPNGLQVEGRAEIRKLAVGVSACQELFARARAAGADAVLVHHGLFWEGMPRTLTGLQYRRVAELVHGEMSLFAYHLPLDRHPEVGNNAVAARAFGLQRVEPFGLYDGEPIGCAGFFPQPIAVTELVARATAVFAQVPQLLGAGRDPVGSLALVSGGGQRELWEAIAKGFDAYLTGESSEWVTNVAREAGIHYLSAGHYATERLGVRALGERLRDEHGIVVEFIDVPNPV